MSRQQDHSIISSFILDYKKLPAAYLINLLTGSLYYATIFALCDSQNQQ
jgi:hypothetical protein